MLRLEITRSPRLALLLAVAHAFAFFLAWATGLPAAVLVAAALILTTSAAYHIALHGSLVLPWSIVAVELVEPCQASIRNAEGKWLEAELLPSSFLWPPFTVLNFRVEGRRCVHTMLVTPGRTSSDVYRRVRVWLRWRCGKGDHLEADVR